jgi:hypothetical protein
MTNWDEGDFSEETPEAEEEIEELGDSEDAF